MYKWWRKALKPHIQDAGTSKCLTFLLEKGNKQWLSYQKSWQLIVFLSTNCLLIVPLYSICLWSVLGSANECALLQHIHRHGTRGIMDHMKWFGSFLVTVSTHCHVDFYTQFSLEEWGRLKTLANYIFLHF